MPHTFQAILDNHPPIIYFPCSDFVSDSTATVECLRETISRYHNEGCQCGAVLVPDEAKLGPGAEELVDSTQYMKENAGQLKSLVDKDAVASQLGAEHSGVIVFSVEYPNKGAYHMSDNVRIATTGLTSQTPPSLPDKDTSIDSFYNTGGLISLDRTRFMTYFYSLNIVCRPPGFGKTTLINTLARFFDVHYNEDFATYFNSARISDLPGYRRRSSLLVLVFDLCHPSLIAEGAQATEQALEDYIMKTLCEFLMKYQAELGINAREFIEEKQNSVNSALARVMIQVTHSGHGMFLAIDNYDTPSKSWPGLLRDMLDTTLFLPILSHEDIVQFGLMTGSVNGSPEYTEGLKELFPYIRTHEPSMCGALGMSLDDIDAVLCTLGFPNMATHFMKLLIRSGFPSFIPKNYWSSEEMGPVEYSFTDVFNKMRKLYSMFGDCSTQWIVSREPYPMSSEPIQPPSMTMATVPEIMDETDGAKSDISASSFIPIHECSDVPRKYIGHSTSPVPSATSSDSSSSSPSSSSRNTTSPAHPRMYGISSFSNSTVWEEENSFGEATCVASDDEESQGEGSKKPVGPPLRDDC